MLWVGQCRPSKAGLAVQIKLPFDTAKPVAGEAGFSIDRSIQEVFAYIGERFFHNYPKWTEDLVNFEPLDGNEMVLGAKARQVRVENGVPVESVFTIADYQPYRLVCHGVSAPYRQSYLLEQDEQTLHTRVTFRFEILELEVFMRPFSKLIRAAIEEGTESTVENIKNLLAAELQYQSPENRPPVRQKTTGTLLPGRAIRYYQPSRCGQRNQIIDGFIAIVKPLTPMPLS